MRLNFLYQITAVSRTPDYVGYRPQIPVLSVLCLQQNLLNPPEQNSWVRHCPAPSKSTMGAVRNYCITETSAYNVHSRTGNV